MPNHQQPHEVTMKQLLLICAVVMGQSVLAADKKPLTKEESGQVIEAVIRKELKKPIGELTKADLEKVKRLDLNNKGITDISALAELKELEVLNIHSNRISDLNPLVELSKLVHLELYENQITDLKPLGRLNSLKILWLTENPKIKDYSPIAGIRGQLESYSSGRNGIANLDVLGIAQMTSLKVLYLHENQLTSVKGLENLDQLTSLYLDGNKLTDVKGLEKLTQLTHLDLENNPDLTKAQIDELEKA